MSVPRTLRALPVAAALVTAAAALAPSAGAATTTTRVRTIDTVLQQQPASSQLATTAGDGRVAWAVQSAGAGDAPDTIALWTLRDGSPVRAAEIPAGAGALSDLELGTEAGGAPVVVLRTTGGDRRTVLRLVRLDTGAVRTISSTRRGLPIGGMALDHGRLYYALHVARPGSRNTSSLWRATLTGQSIGRASRIRTSRRGEVWSDVLADRNRVALRTDRTVRAYGRPGTLEEIAFGTPLGSWSRTGQVIIQEGPFSRVSIVGFTQDRSSVVTTQGQDSATPLATATPIGGRGTVRRVRLGASAATAIGSAAFEPSTGRFLGVGPDATGTAVLGFTARVLPTS